MSSVQFYQIRKKKEREKKKHTYEQLFLLFAHLNVESKERFVLEVDGGVCFSIIHLKAKLKKNHIMNISFGNKIKQ